MLLCIWARPRLSEVTVVSEGIIVLLYIKGNLLKTTTDADASDLFNPLQRLTRPRGKIRGIRA